MAVTVTPSKRRHQLEMDELTARQRIELVNLRERHRQERAELRKQQRSGRQAARAGSDLSDFARSVKSAARRASEGRFGRLVFIDQVWKDLGLGDSLEAFKRRLLQAYRAELVTLSKADMPQTLDPNHLRASEVRDRDRALIFVDPTGRTEQPEAERVRQAYRNLTRKTKSPHVVISDLARDSGVPVPDLQRWIRGEMRSGRADVALGEPTLATPDQLAAAIVLENRPHLYVALLDPEESSP